MSGAVEGVALQMARQFHEAYERLAPSFGYETRPETREFDPASANGRLMVAVCEALTTPPARSYADGVEDAAKVADDYALGALEGGEPLIEATAETIAAAIRLLSQGGKA